MINLKPIPKNLLKNQDIENYKILPYFKFPEGVFKECWEDYPFWRVNDTFDIIYISSCELALVYQDIYKDYKFYPLLVDNDVEIDISDWEIKYKSPGSITYLNTKISHPNSVKIGSFCIREGDKIVYWLSDNYGKTDVHHIIKELGLEDKFNNGIYEILYKGNIWKEVDIYFDWRYFLEMYISYKELSDITIKAEETTPFSEFIAHLFSWEKETKYLNYVRRIYNWIEENNEKK